MGVGLGLYGGTGSLIPDQYGNTASAKLPHILITRDGRVGINQSNPASGQILDITSNLTCVGNVVISGTCTASSLPTSSDKSIQHDIFKADYEEIQNISNSIYVEPYVRNGGIEGSIVGFIANEFDIKHISRINISKHCIQNK